MFRINGSESIPVSLSQTTLSNLEIPPQTLVPAFYVILLELTITNSMYNNTFDEDYLYVRIVLPELVANIKGATMRESNGSEIIVFDASGSYDPITGSAVTTDVISTIWTVLSDSGLRYIDTVNCLASFPECRMLESDSVAWHNISDPHLEYLRLDTSAFLDNTTVFVIFTISRGSRMSSTIQSLYINTGVRPVSLR